MDLAPLIAALSRPGAYPHGAAEVRVLQTHISVVFLAGRFAYKIKKPVNLDFLDYSTLEKRQHYCAEEVRLNRRLAPAVYLGVVPVAQDGETIRVAGRGKVVEWAVLMRRLPEEATLENRLQCRQVRPKMVEALARKIAAFHATAEANAHTAAFGRFDVVARNSRENFAQAAPLVGTTLSQAVYERLQARTEATLERLRPLIEARAGRGVPRDTHGDLRLDHVYLFPKRLAPSDVVVVDCIEFNERFRFADPVADVAFLVMDLTFHGRRDLAQAFAKSYFRTTRDKEGRSLLPFYTAYRAAVRGKVEGFELTEKEVPEAERAAALVRARAHWLLALGELEPPEERPALVLVAGLPGTGKSTLARALASHGGFELIRSDVVRKELAAALPPAADLYTPEWSRATYAECLRRTEARLFEGKRILVDANFRHEDQRLPFLDAARCWAVPALLLVCRADPDVIRRRLERRQGDASDADWAVHQQLAAAWEEPGEAVRRFLREVDTSGRPKQSVTAAAAALRELHLLD